MSRLSKPPVAPVVSANLNDYKLIKQLLSIIGRFDDIVRYMTAAGKSPPCMRLSRTHYADIDARIREQSQGKRDLSQVVYRGFKILSASE